MANPSKPKGRSKQLQVVLRDQLRVRFGADQVLPELLEGDCGLVLGEICRELGYPGLKLCTLFSLAYLAALFFLRGERPPPALVGEKGVLSQITALSPMPRKTLCDKLFPNEFAWVRHPKKTKYRPFFFWSDQRCLRGFPKLGRKFTRVWRRTYSGMRLRGRLRVALEEAYFVNLVNKRK